MQAALKHYVLACLLCKVSAPHCAPMWKEMEKVGAITAGDG